MVRGKCFTQPHNGTNKSIFALLSVPFFTPRWTRFTPSLESPACLYLAPILTRSNRSTRSTACPRRHYREYDSCRLSSEFHLVQCTFFFQKVLCNQLTTNESPKHEESSVKRLAVIICIVTSHFAKQLRLICRP